MIMEIDKHSNVIVLSDSSDCEESISFVKTKKSEICSKKSEICSIDVLSDSSDSNFEFPKVNFYYKKGTKESQSQQQENNSNLAFDSSNVNFSPKEIDLDSGISSGSGTSFSKDSQSSDIDILIQKYSILKRTEDSPEKKKRKPRAQKATDPEKERLRVEKQKKKEEQAKEKVLRNLASKNFKKLKPEECLKSMKVIIDEDIQNCPYFANILSTLRETELTFNFNSQLVPHSISWKRQIEENYMDEKGTVCTRKDIQDENHLIIIWNWDEVVEKIANGTFSPSVRSICNLFPQKRITLVIYGIIGYFSYLKSQRDKAVRNEVLGNEKPKKGYSKSDKLYGASPRISRNDFEVSLTEIQLFNNCSSRIVRTSDELALVVYQFTKAIAETPYKKERNKNMEDKVSWYAAGDNRDTVKVDKDGNGLRRLWQQQLCQFNLSSLETAEAICQVYGSPLQLIEAYMKCTPAEGEMLLKDVPIRRAAGPVTSVRKIGPELSKKIYTMFTSEEGEVLLNND